MWHLHCVRSHVVTAHTRTTSCIFPSSLSVSNSCQLQAECDCYNSRDSYQTRARTARCSAQGDNAPVQYCKYKGMNQVRY